MARLSIVAIVKAKKDSAEFVRGELSNLVPPTRCEEGCIQYLLHQDIETPEVFVFFETWESAEHLEKHLNTDHYQRCSSAIAGMVAEKTVHRLTGIA